MKAVTTITIYQSPTSRISPADLPADWRSLIRHFRHLNGAAVQMIELKMRSYVVLQYNNGQKEARVAPLRHD